MTTPRDPRATASKGAAARLAKWIGLGFGALAALMILAVLILTAANVIGRYFLSAPLRGAEEATGYLVVGMVMLGAAEAYRRGDHIRIDLLSERLGPAGQCWVEQLSHLAVIGFAAVLMWTGWHTVAFSRMFGAYSPGYLQVPLWIPQTALIAGGALLATMAALRLLDDVHRKITHGAPR